MISGAEMVALTTYCDDRGIRLISDEIYHGITYEMPGVTALSHTQNAFIVNSFSKYYSMTGWRVGWMVIPEQLHRSVECLSAEYIHFLCLRCRSMPRVLLSIVPRNWMKTSRATRRIGT